MKNRSKPLPAHASTRTLFFAQLLLIDHAFFQSSEMTRALFKKNGYKPGWRDSVLLTLLAVSVVPIFFWRQLRTYRQCTYKNIIPAAAPPIKVPSLHRYSTHR